VALNLSRMIALTDTPATRMYIAPTFNRVIIIRFTQKLGCYATKRIL